MCIRNGRYRSSFLFTPSSSSVTGSIKVDVHYYEDGNVRLLTEKPVSTSTSSSSAADIVKAIGQVERKYQEELNKAFISMSEGAFKGLRRQLPVTRQKIEWDRVSGYRVSLVWLHSCVRELMRSRLDKISAEENDDPQNHRAWWSFT